MLFKRKKSNRRFKHAFVLDVKLRADQIRQRRFRFVTGLLTFVFVTAFVVFLIWRGGGWLLDKFVFKNAAFALETIEVQTDGVIASDALRRMAGVKPGDNLLALNLSQVKRELERVPLIQAAAVERVLPRTLRLRVVEREPVAQVIVPVAQPAGGAYLYLLDAAGFVMPQLGRAVSNEPQSQPHEQLPVLTGMNTVELRPGRQVESPQIHAALRLLVEFNGSLMAGLADVRRIDVSSPDILRVTTGQGSEITFAVGANPALQLRRWRVVHDQGQRASKAIAALDLSITNNIPARWVEAGSLPPVKPKSAKPSPYRKKNV